MDLQALRANNVRTTRRLDGNVVSLIHPVTKEAIRSLKIDPLLDLSDVGAIEFAIAAWGNEDILVVLQDDELGVIKSDNMGSYVIEPGDDCFRISVIAKDTGDTHLLASIPPFASEKLSFGVTFLELPELMSSMIATHADRYGLVYPSEIAKAIIAEIQLSS